MGWVRHKRLDRKRHGGGRSRRLCSIENGQAARQEERRRWKERAPVQYRERTGGSTGREAVMEGERAAQA